MLATLVIAVALVVAASIAAVAHVIASKKAAGPTRELAAAISLLERILAYDDSVAALSSSHRVEATSIITNYKKELA